MIAQASSPQAEANTNQVEGSHVCDVEGCGRPFATANGLGQHRRRAHPVEYNERINVDRSKKRWSEEEWKLMAGEEARATGSVRYMNQHLMTIFTQRTLEAIKGQRKYDDYKSYVKELVRKRDEPQVEASNQEATNEGTNITYNEEPLNEAIRAGIADLAGNRLRRTRALVALAESASMNEPLPDNELYKWLKANFKHSKMPRGPQYNRQRITEMDPRKRRRQEYAVVQKLYKTDFRSAVRMVLSEENEEVTMPPVEQVTEFWTRMFDNGEVVEGNPPLHNETNEELCNIWSPISEKEISESELANGTAPGPDGITSRGWGRVCNKVRALFYNLILKKGSLDSDLKKARTVLIPKGTGRIGPGDTRPLSITSVVVRQLHRILARRFRCLHKFTDNQRAFIDCDGTLENLSIVSTILADARTSRREVHLASLDLRKAFDSVTHETILDTITAIGCPKPFVEYIGMLYKDSETLLQYGNVDTRISVKRGVLQGDPISPLLFNAVMDRAIKVLPPEIGFKINGLNFNCIAYADDIILVASTREGLQALIDALTKTLASFGLMTNHDKSSTLSLVPSGREKKLKVVTDSRFKVSNQYLTALGVLDTWKYLGILFRGAGVSGCRKDLAADLDKVDRAPLKPQQRLEVLRRSVVPRHLHELVLGRVTITRLRGMDQCIRGHVRKWLRFPKDIPLAYYYACISSGGLGIPNLEQQVPLIKKQRLERFVGGDNDTARAFRQSHFIQRQLEWCSKALLPIGTSVSKSTRLQHWERQLYDKVDTNDLTESRYCAPAHDWVSSRSSDVTGRDYIHYQHIRAGCLPSKARTTRGTLRERTCRAGCRVSETNYHVIQLCQRTHGGRVFRHDRVVNMLEEHFVKKGFTVIKEPKFRTTAGLVKPDMLATKDGKTYVLDFQVVSGRYMQRDNIHKSNKYRNIQDLSDIVKRKCASRAVEYHALTFSYKGLIERNTMKLLEKFQFSKQLCFIIVTSVLRGTWLNWNQFNKSTALTL